MLGGDSRRTSGNHKAGLIVKESRGSLPQILDGLVGRSPGDSHEKPPSNDLRNDFSNLTSKTGGAAAEGRPLRFKE